MEEKLKKKYCFCKNYYPCEEGQASSSFIKWFLYMHLFTFVILGCLLHGNGTKHAKDLGVN